MGAALSTIAVIKSVAVCGEYPSTPSTLCPTNPADKSAPEQTDSSTFYITVPIRTVPEDDFTLV